MSIKHISLDFWNTIGKPNPSFSHERAKFLAAMFECDEDTARNRYTAVKRYLDKAAEDKGVGYSRCRNVAFLINCFWVDPNYDLITEISNTLDQLFEKYPPTIDHKLVEACWRAKSSGVTLSVASNTNFIEGQLINRVCLNDIPFEFFVFSDEIQISKPHYSFFEKVMCEAGLSNPSIKTTKDIVHIGDHAICDGSAAEFGLGFRLVEDFNTSTIINELLDKKI